MAPSRGARPFSAVRFGAVFGSAILIGQLAQFLWLIAGSRAMSTRAFGAVLAAQALYALLQIVVDTGATFYGARRAASGTLDDDARSSITRLRLQLALASALVALAVGAAGGHRSLAATAPFAAALLLFGALNYWERFGLGDSKPWSAYVVARAAGPALAAGAVVAFGGRLPVYAVGFIECSAIVAVSVGFRLGSWRMARLAFHAERGPWRNVVPISVPVVLSQLGLAAGPVLLIVAGRAAAAAIVAVSARLLTGVNGFAGIVVTSLFPRLARGGEGERELSPADAGVVGTGIKVVFAVAASAAAVLLAWPSFFVDLFLNASSSDAEAAAILMLSSAGAAGFSLVLAMVLVAKHREDAMLPVYGASTAVMVVGTLAVVVASPGSEAVLVAGAVAAGQVTSALMLTRPLSPSLPGVMPAARIGAAASVLLAVVGLVGALAPGARWELALLAAAAALATLAWILAGLYRSR